MEKTKETSNREKAIIWWNNLKISEKSPIFRKYYSSGVTTLMDLTGREIEEIWRKEVGDLKLHKGEIVDESYPEDFQKTYLKPNQKQFVEFNRELARKYLNKFNDNSKKQFCLETFNMLSKSDLQYLKACLVEIISER